MKVSFVNAKDFEHKHFLLYSATHRV